ncbi:MAG: hypothetical protein HY741_06005 [Chloroflexi bacterium]|nr:hypothetical protein [Chloroflexota bacterium]
MMQEKFSLGKIVSGYDVWMQAMGRAASKKIEFGVWWRLDATYWRVVWLEATGELCAAERKPSDRYVVLCRLEKKEVNDFMRKWYDGDDLHALLRHFGLASG